MTQKITPNRIAAEDVADFRAWSVPPISDNGRVLPSAEKEAKERKTEELKRSGESIQNVDLPAGARKTGMTAQEMQHIFDEAEKDGFAQGYKEGLDKGTSAGYEAGQQKGLMEMRQQLVAEQQRFQSLTQALLLPIAEQDEDIEHMLLDIICTLTQSVVQRELIIDSSQIVALVKAAVQALPIGAKNLRICLNPDDLAAVEAYAEEQQLDWKFFGDMQLSAGGCRIETGESRVDFSVSKRLHTLLEQFISKQLVCADEYAGEDKNYAADDAFSGEVISAGNRVILSGAMSSSDNPDSADSSVRDLDNPHG